MIIRELTESDANAFSNLIIDMYQHVDDIEGFVPIPYDNLNIRCMLTNRRYYFLGAFEDDMLIGLTCLDYLCSDLIKETDLQNRFEFEKIIELNFVVVHSQFRGKGVMRELFAHVVEKVTAEHYTIICGKANKFNFSTISSYLHSQFERLFDYQQKINKEDFKFIANSPYLKPATKYSALNTLKRFEHQKFITLKYSVLVKHLQTKALLKK